MTPLAYYIVKDLTLPLKRRRGVDQFSQDIAKRLSGAHCFDLTAVWPLVENLAHKIAYGGHEVGPLGFLPAEKTWIEFRRSTYPSDCRVGFLIEASADGRRATFTECSECGDYTKEQLDQMARGIKVDPEDVRDAYCAGTADQILYLFHDEGSRAGWSESFEHLDPSKFSAEEIEGITNWDPSVIFACLALINSPRIIGRRQHMPHRGLERKLVAQKTLVGKFPLHAWTEIKLEVTAPRDVSDESSTEAHLTGERALHFCRAHLRIRLGKLEIVSSHWRGNPALGIKQSRYKLVA